LQEQITEIIETYNKVEEDISRAAQEMMSISSRVKQLLDAKKEFVSIALSYLEPDSSELEGGDLSAFPGVDPRVKDGAKASDYKIDFDRITELVNFLVEEGPGINSTMASVNKNLKRSAARFREAYELFRDFNQDFNQSLKDKLGIDYEETLKKFK
jgi:hypothetical protein